MTAVAEVLALLPDGRVQLKIRREAACGSCSSCSGCDGAKQCLTVTALNTVSAKPGDRVLVDSDAKTAALPLLTVFLLPVLLFLLGYVLGLALHIPPLLPGAAGVILAIGAAFLLNRSFKNKELYRVTGFAEES